MIVSTIHYSRHILKGYVPTVQLDEPVSPLERWALDPSIHHLNHGSYGGCLRSVLETAAGVRARMEAAPMRFFGLDWQRDLDRARARLAAFVGAPAERLVFVPNTTTGVAIALQSIDLASGDEILTTDHTYRACKNQLDRYAEARNLRITTISILSPFDPDALVDATRRAISPHTRLALFDHITSPTALRLPIEPILDLLVPHGILTIIDGAHAPGQIDLSVGALLDRGATFYIGNNHKWLCSPKGSGFLAAHPGELVKPIVTSHGATSSYGPPIRLHAELDWSGTHDPTAHLAVPAALDAVAQEGGGWPNVFERNHALALEMARRFVDAMGPTPKTRIPPAASVGSMIALRIELPAGTTPLGLELQLLEAGWEVPIVDFAIGPLVRLSAHLYNHAGQAEALARELRDRGVRLR